MKLYFSRDALVPFITDRSIQSTVGFSTIGDAGGIGYVPGVCSDIRIRSSAIKQAGWKEQATGEVTNPV